MAPIRSSLFRRVLNSVFPDKAYTRAEKPTGRFLLRNLPLHFRPTTVPESTLKFTLSWGLGGMAAVLILVQFVTGIFLKFVYEPLPSQAYSSIVTLRDQVLFGKLIRNIHYWSANFLVFVAFLHFLRTFFTGAFLGSRQLTWIIGLGLFFLVLAANLTGYLLPWDQLAYWAVTICMGLLDYIPVAGHMFQSLIRPGPEIGETSLRIFYSLHTAVIPLTMVILLAFHFWRVRKAGGLVAPVSAQEGPAAPANRIPVVPNLLLRELVVGLVLIAFILVVSIFFNAPLDKPANPGLSPNPTKAPWYFAGIQELLLHIHPVFAAGIIPLLVLGALVLLPYLNYEQNASGYEKDPSGIWFVSGTGRRTARMAALASLTLTPLIVLLDDYVIDPHGWFPGLPAAVADGMIPLLLLLLFIAGGYMLIKKKYSGSNHEAIQAVFVFLCASLVIMTMINVWFRGPSMALMWPV
jgi:quinol-cytochrome oxidoreductase complex cytochrome b subunit